MTAADKKLAEANHIYQVYVKDSDIWRMNVKNDHAKSRILGMLTDLHSYFTSRKDPVNIFRAGQTLARIEEIKKYETSRIKLQRHI